jgi:hypothetical protein
MFFLTDLFVKPYPAHNKADVERMLDELVRIGKTDDFLSERPGGGFDRNARHVRAREIGQRLHEIGGLTLMEYANRFVRRKLGKNMSWHLEAAWRDIGDWIA